MVRKLQKIQSAPQLSMCRVARDRTAKAAEIILCDAYQHQPSIANNLETKHGKAIENRILNYFRLHF